MHRFNLKVLGLGRAGHSVRDRCKLGAQLSENVSIAKYVEQNQPKRVSGRYKYLRYCCELQQWTCQFPPALCYSDPLLLPSRRSLAAAANLFPLLFDSLV